MAVTGLVVPYELETEAQIFFELRGGFGRGFKRKWYLMNKKNNKPVASLLDYQECLVGGRIWLSVVIYSTSLASLILPWMWVQLPMVVEI